MLDFKIFADKIIDDLGLEKVEAYQQIISFFEDNKWFDNPPKLVNGKVFLTDANIQVYTKPLIDFLKFDNTRYNTLHNMFYKKFPETSELLDLFCSSIELVEDSQFYLIDFLLYNLNKDIFLMSDEQVKNLVNHAAYELTKAHGDILTFFLSWIKTKRNTRYKLDFTMKQRMNVSDSKNAYDFEQYTELLYYLYNEEYILENDMYLKAAESKNYADTWLYLSLHYLASIRTTDWVRIKHPILPSKPETVLNEIKNSRFTDKDARAVLNSIIWRLCVLPLVPNKTKDTDYVPSIKISVPEHCEVHIGTLFAIAEAHRLIEDIPDDIPLIRKISDYERITRYMGDDIGSLFLTANFHSRSANKSYLQTEFMMADSILGIDSNGPKVKGYILASLARNHKGSYGEYASTTAIYLKDAKMSGLTPEFVAMELFERGVLSFIPSMLLKLITEGEYNKLSVHNQTELIKILNLSPIEIEKTVAITEKAQKRANNVVNQILMCKYSNEEILNALHSVGSGSAFSKQSECMCILQAFHKICPYNNRQQCIGCEYEISTKSTVFLLVSEYNRIYMLYENSSTDLEKLKYKNIITQVILPSMDEVLTCTKEQYGEETFRIFEQMIKENII